MAAYIAPNAEHQTVGTIIQLGGTSVSNACPVVGGPVVCALLTKSRRMNSRRRVSHVMKFMMCRMNVCFFSLERLVHYSEADISGKLVQSIQVAPHNTHNNNYSASTTSRASLLENLYWPHQLTIVGSSPAHGPPVHYT